MSDTNERSVASTGSADDPAAWWFKCDEYESVTLLREHAEAMAEPYGTTPLPLYRSPTLTDAERVAVEAAAEDCRYHQDPGGRAAFIEATLRGLIERLGGGK